MSISLFRSLATVIMLSNINIPTSSYPSLNSHGQRSNQYFLRNRDLQNGVPYRVELLLSLDYLNDTIAIQFETSGSTPSNNATFYFCYAINTQASGNQVDYNAAVFGASIQTRQVQIDDDQADSECSIINTTRNYDVDIDILEQELFSLEIAVEQVVYVESNGTTLSLQQVSSIVETGFSRGEGGRVKFRSLLISHPAFRTVVNIDVLDSVYNPSGHISNPPSGFPSLEIFTAIPTDAPTLSRPNFPPTEEASFPTGIPSTQPLTIPAEIPSDINVLWPSTTPTTSSPTHRPLEPISTLSPQTSNYQTTLIAGAIVGSVAFVLATLFLIFCIWYPFCVGQKNDDENDPALNSTEEAKMKQSDQSSSPTAGVNSVSLPGLLSLDCDTHSLANTTLDGNSSALGQGRITSTESIDDSSIYTSTTDPLTTVLSQHHQHPQTWLSNLMKIDLELNEDRNNVSAISNVFSSQSPTSQGTEQYILSDIKPSQTEITTFSLSDDDKEHYADDESSFDLGDKTTLVNPFPDPASDARESVQTIQAHENATQISTASHPHSFQNGDKYDTIDHVYPKNNFDHVNIVQSASKTLHELFMKNSNGNTKISKASKSHSSLQSAPSRLVSPDPRAEYKANTIHFGRPPHGHRRIATDQSSLPPAISLRRLDGSTKFSLKNSISGQVNGIRRSILNEQQYRHDDPVLNEFVGLQMPSTDIDPSENGHASGVQPRKSMHITPDRVETDAPTLSSDIFGTSSGASSLYDSLSGSGRSDSWIVDTDEQTLESFSRVNDVGSSSSRSSRSSLSKQINRISSKSLKSSTYSNGVRHVDKNEKSIEQNIESNRRDWIQHPNADEQKSSELTNTLNYWSNETSVEVAVEQFATSSISGSSTSASRSTLSSKIEAQYRKKYVDVIAPPGKINVVLASCHNGKGPIVSEVRSTSSMQGKLSPGDELGTLESSLCERYFPHPSHCLSFDNNAVAIDGDDVSQMVVAKITEIMSSRERQNRKLTVLRVSPPPTDFLDYQETKHEGSP